MSEENDGQKNELKWCLKKFKKKVDIYSGKSVNEKCGHQRCALVSQVYPVPGMLCTVWKRRGAGLQMPYAFQLLRTRIHTEKIDSNYIETQ